MVRTSPRHNQTPPANPPLSSDDLPSRGSDSRVGFSKCDYLQKCASPSVPETVFDELTALASVQLPAVCLAFEQMKEIYISQKPKKRKTDERKGGVLSPITVASTSPKKRKVIKKRGRPKKENVARKPPPTQETMDEDIESDYSKAKQGKLVKNREAEILSEDDRKPAAKHNDTDDDSDEAVHKLDTEGKSEADKEKAQKTMTTKTTERAKTKRRRIRKSILIRRTVKRVKKIIHLLGCRDVASPTKAQTGFSTVRPSAA
jgi:hypothetical protein